MNFDLARMRRAMDQLGNPQNTYPAVHIAGTNGKGSVAAMVAAVLRQSGLRVGLNTSPHLEKINERFQINGVMISNEDFARLSRRLKQLFPHFTEFEFLTAIAFLWFAEQKVDIAVVEVGLGGRLDATNIMENVLVSVITTIDFDHMDWLGNTIPKIAFEKAGIIKPGVPVVTGTFGAALRVIRAVAGEKRAPLTVVPPGSLAARAPLEGHHQRHNTAIALAAIEKLRRYFLLTPEAVEKGLKALRWPGRFERFMVGSGPRRKTVVLDGAHNPAGCRVLAAVLIEKRFAPVNLLFGALRDKNVAAMAKILAPVAKTCVTVPVASERTSDAKTLARLSAWKGKALPVKSAAEGLKKILSVKNDRPVVVAGSLYLVGEVRRRIR